jgi:hypothetical protein
VRVLVACEFSGAVREAFRAAGHDAWSCDLLPAEDLSPRFAHHYIGDVRELLAGTSDGGPWDLMIAHPPCTFLANSANKHLWIDGKRSNGRNEQRWRDMKAAAVFFRELWAAPIPRICIENPVMGRNPGIHVNLKWTQTIQPWQFGHGEIKRTCLWLKNLPQLVPTNIVEGRQPRVHHETPGPDRWKNRSRTLRGIAAAMAEQWGG